MSEPCTSENCHAWRTYGFAHTHPQDTAAGPRALISRLQQLNDDGTPAEPAEQDSPAVGRSQDYTTRHALPNYMQQSVNGDALMQRLVAAVSVDDDGTVEDRPSVWSRQILADVLRASKTVLNVHAVSISDKHLHCIASCSGPLPHVSEYRAADVRPSTAQTARNNAADANKMPDSNNTNPA